MNAMVSESGYKGKKVLIVGLGVLGGGLATTRWFLRRGAEVTVTDLRTRAQLAPSIRALGKDARRVRFVLGKHELGDFRSHDLIVVNPAVPRESPYLRAARKAGRSIVNDASTFFDAVRNPTVAVTGTRGKTTTANWTAHFLGVRAGGNSSADLPLLKLLDVAQKSEPVVVELSSWQLELMDRAERGPDVAVITNILRDHMNRYRSMAAYARAKANIMRRQTAGQRVILSAESAWTPFFLRTLSEWKVRSHVYFFSLSMLPRGRNGIFVDRGAVYVRENGRTHVVLPRELYERCSVWGEHNIKNLIAAVLAAHFAGIPWRTIRARIPTLPQVPLREEVIRSRSGLVVVNDSAGTSPDATIVALERFSRPFRRPPGATHRILLLSGGTDKELDFHEWARYVTRSVEPRDLFLLEGSATKKMVGALRRTGYFGRGKANVFGALPAMVRAAYRTATGYVARGTHCTILFSPGAASFEKFKNEFDRGEKFTLYCRQIIRK